MKVLKIIGYFLVGFTVLWFIAAAVAPSSVQVSDSIVINQPAEVIYGEVSDFKRWDAWSPWAKDDPNMIQTYSEHTGLDAWVEWESEVHEGGKQTWVEMEPHAFMSSKMNFEGMDGDNMADWTLEEGDEGTTVTWTMDGAEMPFVFKPFTWIIVPDVSERYRRGLENLKALCESMPKEEKTYRGYKVEEVELEPRTYVAFKDTIPHGELAEFYAKHLPVIHQACQKKELTLTSMPSGLYFHWDHENAQTILAAGVSVEDPGDGIEGYELYEVSGMAARIAYYGDYTQSAEAHGALNDYLAKNELTQRAPVVEEFMNDPMTEPDTSKILTHIYYLYD